MPESLFSDFVKFLRTPFLQNTTDDCFRNMNINGFANFFAAIPFPHDIKIVISIYVFSYFVSRFNLFYPSVTFHIETSYLICTVKPVKSDFPQF